MNEENSDRKTVNFRLSSIEKSLEELKEGIKAINESTSKFSISEKLQDRDISDIQKDIEEMKVSIKELQKDVKDLKDQPFKDKASKWQLIADYIFKSAVVCILGFAAAKFKA